jgi:hypothetical protein
VEYVFNPYRKLKPPGKVISPEVTGWGASPVNVTAVAPVISARLIVSLENLKEFPFHGVWEIAVIDIIKKGKLRYRRIQLG